VGATDADGEAAIVGDAAAASVGRGEGDGLTFDPQAATRAPRIRPRINE
jgi:hypothetical protein